MTQELQIKITELGWPVRSEGFPAFQHFQSKHVAANSPIHLYLDVGLTNDQYFASELTLNSQSVNEQKIKLHCALLVLRKLLVSCAKIEH